MEDKSLQLNVIKVKENQQFKEVGYGQVFIFDDKYYLRIYHTEHYNVVELPSGKLSMILNDEIVAPVKATLTVFN